MWDTRQRALRGWGVAGTCRSICRNSTCCGDAWRQFADARGRDDIAFHAEEFFIGPMLTLIPPTACLLKFALLNPVLLMSGLAFMKLPRGEAITH